MTINYKYFMFNQFSNANSGTSIDWDALNAASENNNDEVKFDDKKTQKLLDRTKKCIRSILLSSKGGTGIHEIEHQYHELFEEGIAYRKFGFQSLESFLRNLPSVCRVYQLGHMGVMVEGVADSETRSEMETGFLDLAICQISTTVM